MAGLLAGLLALGVIGVSINALTIVGLADIERHGHLVRSHIRAAAVGADTAVLQSRLE